MRKIGLLCLLFVFMLPLQVQAQESCDSTPARLTPGQSGLVDVRPGFFLNLRAEPGLDGPTLLRLADGEIFDVVEGPRCVGGLLWWHVQQFNLSGWIAESDGQNYMVLPYEGPTQGLPAPTLAPVLLAANPTELDTPFIHWDWAQFLKDSNSYREIPDPLTVTLPETYQGTDLPAGPFDLDNVRFVGDANLNAAQSALLAQNGFVVVPGNRPFFEDAYYGNADWDAESGHAIWVTTDGVLHALHVSFDNLLKMLEMDTLSGSLLQVVQGSYQAAADQLVAMSGTDLESPARSAALYYAVALGLLDSDSYQQTVSEDVRAEADPLIAAAMQAQGRLEVPFMGEKYSEDFSQYTPRGHYSGSPEMERYFRAMMWLGRLTFLAKDDAALRSSLFALRALEKGGQHDAWAMIGDWLTFLIGPTDNLGPGEYLPLAQQLYGQDLSPEKFANADLLAQFKQAVQALPGPRINNVVRPIGTEASELDEATRGFRLFGQRFTFDGYAMQRLIFPDVGTTGNERTLPSGLDIAAALGSDTAYSLLDAQGDTAYAHYVDHLAALRSDVSAMNPPDWFQNAYGGWLWALQPLWARNPAPYPSLMSSDAWLKRDLQAGLASWAELKHDTILYVVQPMGGLGGGGEQTLTSYNMVEPNPLVFSRIAMVAAAVGEGMARYGVGDPGDFSSPPPGSYYLREAFNTLAQLSAMLTDMARKELWGQPLSDDEQLFLKYNYGSMLSSIRYMAEEPLEVKPELGAIVADVASNPDAGTALEVGTGYVDLIYVISDSPKGLQVTRGTVYSYYEFQRSIDQRLNDDTWRGMVTSGELPPRPAWVNAFYAQ